MLGPQQARVGAAQALPVAQDPRSPLPERRVATPGAVGGRAAWIA